MTFHMKELKNDEEIEKIAALAAEIWREHYTSLIGAAQTEYMVETFQSAAQIKKDIVEENYSYFAVCLPETEEQIAYLALHPDEKGVYISKVYVKKEYRRQGIAQRMIEFALQFAREKVCPESSVFERERNGRPSLRLSVNKGNAGSIAFYKKVGFSIESASVTDIGNGFCMDDYIMALYWDAE